MSGLGTRFGDAARGAAFFYVAHGMSWLALACPGLGFPANLRVQCGGDVAVPCSAEALPMTRKTTLLLCPDAIGPQGRPRNFVLRSACIAQAEFRGRERFGVPALRAESSARRSI